MSAAAERLRRSVNVEVGAALNLVGALLIAYSFIVLLLRKMGLIGPRRAER